MLGNGKKRALDGRSEPLIDKSETQVPRSNLQSRHELDTGNVEMTSSKQQPALSAAVQSVLAPPPPKTTSPEITGTQWIEHVLKHGRPPRSNLQQHSAESEITGASSKETADSLFKTDPKAAPSFWGSLFAAPQSDQKGDNDSNTSSNGNNQVLERLANAVAGVIGLDESYYSTGSYEPSKTGAVGDVSLQPGSPRNPINLRGSPQHPIDLRHLQIPEEGDEETGGIVTKVPSGGGWLGMMYRIGTWCSGPSVLLVIFVFTAFGFIYGASREFGYDLNLRHIFERVDWEREVNIAFIGNAYLFVNDVPRIMQAISRDHIHQNSVIHPGGSLGSLLLSGNGMYNAWKTDAADLGQQYIKEYGRKEGVYDFGVCSVKQLLLGSDEYMGYNNPYGVYKNDGLNPCIMDKYYYSYVAGNLAAKPIKWDYVVLAGQTKRMVVESARNDTLYELVNSYAPMLNESGAIPLLVDTHAFWSDRTNMTGLGNDVPSFTAQIQHGVQLYASALAEALPRSQAPIIAPVGVAYLTVWEENYDLWRMLFVRDMVHASVYGSFLFACVLYMTIFGHRLPDNDLQLQSDIADLFANSRKLVGGNHYFPSQEEVLYLRNVARRVVLKGYVPPSLRKHGSSR